MDPLQDLCSPCTCPLQILYTITFSTYTMITNHNVSECSRNRPNAVNIGSVPVPPHCETRMSRRKRRHLKSPRSLTVSSASRSHSGCLFYIRASYWFPSLSFHDNRASHSQDTIWPWKFKIKGQGRMYPSQCSVQLTHSLSVSHQGILWSPFLFVPWQSGLPFPRYNLTLKIQGQKSRSKVKVKGTLVSIASSWLTTFLFNINWTNHSWGMANIMFDCRKWI